MVAVKNVDKPLFEINANTRTIKIPEAFKNGITIDDDTIEKRNGGFGSTTN